MLLPRTPPRLLRIMKDAVSYRDHRPRWVLTPAYRASLRRRNGL